MLKKLLACAAGALGLMLAYSTFQPAEAKSHSGQSHGGKSYSHVGHVAHAGKPFVKNPHFIHNKRFSRHHHHKRIVVAYSDYGYADGCYWLRRKALSTGSRYWWNRYYACTSDY